MVVVVQRIFRRETVTVEVTVRRGREPYGSMSVCTIVYFPAGASTPLEVFPFHAHAYVPVADPAAYRRTTAPRAFLTSMASVNRSFRVPPAVTVSRQPSAVGYKVVADTPTPVARAVLVTTDGAAEAVPGAATLPSPAYATSTLFTPGVVHVTVTEPRPPASSGTACRTKPSIVKARLPVGSPPVTPGSTAAV